jgi:hypothetical protein
MRRGEQGESRERRESTERAAGRLRQRTVRGMGTEGGEGLRSTRLTCPGAATSNVLPTFWTVHALVTPPEPPGSDMDRERPEASLPGSVRFWPSDDSTSARSWMQPTERTSGEGAEREPPANAVSVVRVCEREGVCVRECV